MPQSKKISNVPLIGQSKLPTGCETCSATMLLNFYGYKISETTFADKYLVKNLSVIQTVHTLDLIRIVPLLEHHTVPTATERMHRLW